MSCTLLSATANNRTANLTTTGRTFVALKFDCATYATDCTTLIEEAVIANMQPPLNLRKGSKRFRTQVDAARRWVSSQHRVSRVAQIHGEQA